MSVAVLALGSNMGDRLANLRLARGFVCGRFAQLAAAGVYETPPAFYADQPPFYNSAVAVSAELPAPELLAFCKGVEKKMGRAPSFRNAPRPIDIDIIFYEGRDCRGDALTIPHIGWRDRAFVITPLLDIRAAGVLKGAYFAAADLYLAAQMRAYKKICDL